MKLLKRDTRAEIAKTTAHLAEVSSRLIVLRDERSKVVLDGDLEAVVAADAAIAREEARITVLQEKLKLLDQTQKQENHENQVAAKKRAFEDFAGAYRAQRVNPATEIVELIGQLGDAYAKYKQTRDLPFKRKYDLRVFPNYVIDRFSPYTPYDNLLVLISNALGLDEKNADNHDNCSDRLAQSEPSHV